ncbi:MULTISPECIES: DUF1351 domain-containing protein [unclassified Thioalkalivibrio]|uniref:DUF1351 domain-containing protein n=1 Tax=unclassified Thioalkalivibrio TaxID=2621013 RepID=UPI000373DE0A|nr:MULTISPECIES: DUF1351 domain-containing protein [unclassified Thioalkalivibrio]
MEMQNLIRIETQPAVLDLNFEQLEKALDERLAQYETVVTEDGVKDAKAAATEINKLKGELASRRKAAADEAKAPIAAFEKQIKTLESKCEDARQGILGQVQKYEDQVREEAREMLSALRADGWDELEVEDHHQRAEIEDLVKVTAVTAKGNLAKGPRETLEARVREDKARQDKVRMRLLELENASYRAGLSAPLTQGHVHRVLESDDATYSAELQRILEAELQREQVARQREQERQERQAAAAEATRANRPDASPINSEPQQHTAPMDTTEQHTPDPPPRESSPGKHAVTVVGTFETEVPPGVSDEQLESALRKKMESAGITSLTRIEIHRHQAAA